MSKIIPFIILSILLAIILIYALDSLASSQAKQTNAQANLEYARGQARAIVLEAQGQARMDTAIASQTIMLAAIPLLVLAVLGILGLAIVVLVAYLSSRPKEYTRLTETRIVYLPPQVSHREIWQRIADNQPILIEAEREQNNES